MFTLAKLLYIVCDEDEKFFYDDLKTVPIEVEQCCTDALSNIKNQADETSNEASTLPDGSTLAQRLDLSSSTNVREIPVIKLSRWINDIGSVYG
jgi:hypothetical protein